MLVCPICGCEINPFYLESYAEKRTILKDGEEIIQYKCKYCDSFMTPVKLKHDFLYYYKKAEEKYDNNGLYMLAILDEIKEYGLFDKEKHQKASDKESEEFRASNKKAEAIRKRENTPKCPTCGSTNIQKISTTSKVVGASLFGLFSKNATSQFKCNNCGYKW